MNSKFIMTENWDKYSVVAFDTETSGQFAIESEIIELGAVKYFNGEIIDRFQTLLKPSKLLTEDNIKIHGITNEMVTEAPLMSAQILKFSKFVNGSVLLAHHAPFDLGFLTVAFENNSIIFPETINLCTSLLSRSLLHTTNHKLQTLIKELKLSGGEAHRAYDDAYACLQVFFKCIEKLVSRQSLNDLLNIQNKNLAWTNYAIQSSNDEKLKMLYRACEKQKEISMTYLSGQTKGEKRIVTPFGIVRNPDGDYLSAYCHIDNQRKRFYIHKIIL